MNFYLEHKLPGRMRLRCSKGSFTSVQARAVEEILKTQEVVLDAAVSHRTGSVLIYHKKGTDASILEAARRRDKTVFGDNSVPETNEPSLGDSLLSMFTGVTLRALLPTVVRYPLIFLRSLPILGRGLRSLLCDKRLAIPALDAAAV